MDTEFAEDGTRPFRIYNPAFVRQVYQKRRAQEGRSTLASSLEEREMLIRTMPEWLLNILRETASNFDESPADIMGSHGYPRKVVAARGKFFWLAKAANKVTLLELAELTGKSPSGIINSIRGYCKRTGEPMPNDPRRATNA